MKWIEREEQFSYLRMPCIYYLTRHIYKFVLICIFKDTITQMKEKIQDMGENILLKDIDINGLLMDY